MASEASNFLINNSRNIMNAVDSASEDVEATKGYSNKGDEAYLFGSARFIFEHFAFLE